MDLDFIEDKSGFLRMDWNFVKIKNYLELKLVKYID